MTDQQFKDDCDVNFIVNKFTKTGHLTHLAKFQGMYAEVARKGLPESDLKNKIYQKLKDQFQSTAKEFKGILDSKEYIVTGKMIAVWGLESINLSDKFFFITEEYSMLLEYRSLDIQQLRFYAMIQVKQQYLG